MKKREGYDFLLGRDLQVLAEAGDLGGLKDTWKTLSPKERSSHLWDVAMFAVVNDKSNVLKWSLENDLDVNHLNEDEENLLHMVARAMAIRCAKILVDARVDKNSPCSEGNTPLHLASRWVFDPAGLELCRMMITKENVSIKNHMGKTPSSLARDLEGKYSKNILSSFLDTYVSVFEENEILKDEIENVVPKARKRGGL